MNSEENTSGLPVKKPPIVNCFDATAKENLEQSFININIKNEPLDITDKDNKNREVYDSMEYSPRDKSKTCVPRSSSKLIDDSNHFITYYQDILSKTGDGSKCISNLEFFDIDTNFKSCQNLCDDSEDINQSSNESSTISNTSGNNNHESVLDNQILSSVDKRYDTSQESEDALENSLLLADNTFSCSLCSFTTDKKRVLNDHERNHRKSNLPIVQCVYCSQRYTRYMLYLHVQNVHPGQKFQIRDEVPKQVEAKRTLGTLTCPECSFSTTEQEEFKLHEKKHLADDEFNKVGFECSTCRFSTTDLPKLELHMKKHLLEPLKRTNQSGRRMFDCRMCSYACPNFADINMHINTHGKNSPIIKCSSCNFKSTSHALKFHMRKCKRNLAAASVESSKEVSSEVTQSSVDTEREVTTPFDCSMCSFSTPDQLLLKLHLKTHILEPIKVRDSYDRLIFACAMCSYMAPKFADMNAHINSHKKNVPLKQCAKCDFKSTQRALHYHLRKCIAKPKSSRRDATKNISRKVKAFRPKKPTLKCSTCSFSTIDQLKLKLHKKKHLFEPVKRKDETGRQIFACRLCSYGCTKFSVLFGHINSHRSKMPILKCLYCNFKSTKRALKFHMRKCGTNSKSSSKRNNKGIVGDGNIDHTSEPNTVAPKATLLCSSCSFSTNEKQTLTLHMKKHLFEPVRRTDPSGRQIYACRMCSYGCTKLSEISRHINSHRKNAPIKKCPYCKFKSTSRVLKYHFRKCRVISEASSTRQATGMSAEVSTDQSLATVQTEPNELFKCTECAFSTSLRTKLTLHKSTCHSNKDITFRCEYCSFVTAKRINHKQHMKSHARNLPIKKCFHCSFKSTYQILSKHMRGCASSKGLQSNKPVDSTISDEGSKDCPTGGSVINAANKSMFQCSQCAFSTSLRIKLNFHTKKYHQKLYKCSYCSYTCIKIAALKQHVETHTQWKSSIKKCENCDYRSTLRALRLHACKCEGKRAEENTVTPLGADTELAGRFEPTIENTHDLSRNRSKPSSGRDGSQSKSPATSTKKMFSCTTCAFASLSKNNFKDHMDSHREPEDAGQNQSAVPDSDREEVFMNSPGMYACDVCSYTSPARSNLQSHKDAHRKRNLPIVQCSNCNYRSTPKALSLHLLKCNTTTKPGTEVSSNADSNVSEVHRCTLCSYTATLKSNLKRHLDTHGILNVPVKQCANCDFKGTRSVLEKHGPKCPNKTTQKVLLQCVKCSYSTYLPKILKAHEEKNHPEKKEIKRPSPKSFKCEYCSFTSFWTYLIERHMNSHTLLKLPIEQCGKCDFRSTPAALQAHTKACTKGSRERLSDVSPNKKAKLKTDSCLLKVDENRRKIGKGPSNVPANSIPNNKARSAESPKTDSCTAEVNENVKKVDSIIAEEANATTESRNEVAPLNTSNEANDSNILESPCISFGSEVYVNQEKIETTNNTDDISAKGGNDETAGANSPAKAVFNCPECSFVTHLRAKLNFHLQNNHLLSTVDNEVS